MLKFQPLFLLSIRKKEKFGSAYQLHVSLFIDEASSPEFPPAEFCLYLGPGDKKKLKKHIFDYLASVVGGIIVEECGKWLLGSPINSVVT